MKNKMNEPFMDSMMEAEMRNIELVKSNKVPIENPLVKPEEPSLKGKKITIAYKDPDAVGNSVEDFMSELLKDVENCHLIENQVAEKVYKAIGRTGEMIFIEIDLDTGMRSIKE